MELQYVDRLLSVVNFSSEKGCSGLTHEMFWRKITKMTSLFFCFSFDFTVESSGCEGLDSCLLTCNRASPLTTAWIRDGEVLPRLLTDRHHIRTGNTGISLFSLSACSLLTAACFSFSFFVRLASLDSCGMTHRPSRETHIRW